jgi:hypothetical protein
MLDVWIATTFHRHASSLHWINDKDLSRKFELSWLNSYENLFSARTLRIKACCMSGDNLPLILSFQPYSGSSIAALNVYSFALNSVRESAAGNNGVAVGNHLDVFFVKRHRKLLPLSRGSIAFADPRYWKIVP